MEGDEEKVRGKPDPVPIEFSYVSFFFFFPFWSLSHIFFINYTTQKPLQKSLSVSQHQECLL